MEEQEKQEQCQKCGRLRGKSGHKQLCQKCLKSLPYCESCGIICGAREWGFYEEKAVSFIFKKNNEKVVLCGGCEEQLMQFDSLRLENKGRKGEYKLEKEELIKK